MNALNTILATFFEFFKGLPNLLHGLLGVLNEAPEPYREWLVAAFWIVVAFLPMTWLALKILSSQPYRNAYQLIGKVGMALFQSSRLGTAYCERPHFCQSRAVFNNSKLGTTLATLLRSRKRSYS